jgi:hypothetical protein
VLLHNGNVLFGEATQSGDQVLVRRGPDHEVRLNRSDVACWAGSLHDLYRYRVDHRRGDIAGLIEDAKWCLRYDLPNLARREVAQVLLLDPEHAEANRLDDYLTRLPIASRGQNAAERAETIRGVRHTTETTLAALGDSRQLILQTFAAQIQPLLLNRCGNCHTQRSERPWKLTKPSPGARASARMTRENLAATLAQTDPLAPQQSPLWIQAITAHGGVEAGLDDRHATGRKALGDWLLLLGTTTESPDGAERTMPAGAAVAPHDEPRTFVAEQVSAADPSAATGWPQDAAAASAARAPSPRVIDGPARLPAVDDPFDPDLFNRRFHAGRKP